MLIIVSLPIGIAITSGSWITEVHFDVSQIVFVLMNRFISEDSFNIKCIVSGGHLRIKSTQPLSTCLDVMR